MTNGIIKNRTEDFNLEYAVIYMANKEEAISKQLKQLEKLTPEQIANGLRLWLGHESDLPLPHQNKTPNAPK